jgi:hypothetical protein
MSSSGPRFESTNSQIDSSILRAAKKNFFDVSSDPGITNTDISTRQTAR